MTSLTATPPAPAATSHDAAIKSALDRVPPLWPLDHFVAVNPFVGLTSHAIEQASDQLIASHGITPFQTPADYLAAWDSGDITPADLQSAADGKWTNDQLVAELKKAIATDTQPAISTVSDLFDRIDNDAHWIRFITDEISKWCGVAYDENQTTWNTPWKTLGLFTGWRNAAQHDRNPESYGLSGFRAFVSSLPSDTDAAIAHCLDILDPQEAPVADFLHRELTSIAGWAGHVRYRVREDELRGIDNPALHDLLAIRLAYDAALLLSEPEDSPLVDAWKALPSYDASSSLSEILSTWQDAYELGYRTSLAAQLVAQPSQQFSERPAVQAIFCIDVRSEVFRRNLEAAQSGIQTIGFAGFFGFPVAHTSSKSPDRQTTRCPVLLVPPVASNDGLDPIKTSAADQKHAEAGAWKAFQNSAASCFSFVESAGIAFGAVLGKAKKSHSCCAETPTLDKVELQTRADLAQGALKNMGLTDNFARLVLVCGHGSHSANNPYASALDCGACGGHAGDLNARLAASTLNEPEVRAELAQRGISIPDDTIFIAGLHDTLCDDVTIFATGSVPSSHSTDLADLQKALEKAAHSSRVERAPKLGLTGVEESALADTIRKRATDISQVRPEWGLANCAAIIAAPRSRTAGLDLGGRVFLQDYDATTDTDGSVLNLILCAPVVVASWINLQYYASRIAPDVYGSGDKTIHHVVGGIGVMEGNQGDLKTGLPIQSIHDGHDFVHEPRRLSVIVEAAPSAIDAVLDANPSVSELFDNGWITLVALQGSDALQKRSSDHRGRDLRSRSLDPNNSHKPSSSWEKIA